MKVITAVDDYNLKEDEISVFLAGGITNCPEWQDKVIEHLKAKFDTDKLVVFNPRRKNFPIGVPSAAFGQIKWEFKQLEKMDIFSMYFCGGDSDQPICMYELGRNIVRMQNRFPADWRNRIVISVEEGYKRKEDVIVQTHLATEEFSTMHLNSLKDPDLLLEYHANTIYEAYQYIEGRII